MRTERDWQSLIRHGERLRGTPLRTLVQADPGRAKAMALRVGPIYANFARQHVDGDADAALLDFARAADVEAALARLFDGGIVNVTEQRPALHSALRGDIGAGEPVAQARALVADARARMDALHAELAAGDVTDVVSVGIGGSDLGPRLAVDALKDFADGRFRVHFLANVDGSAAQHLLRGLDPARTAAILVSKSFGTEETLLNGAILRDWLGGGERLYAVSANVERAAAFGVDGARLLPMWDWVGGRYSLWSAVGFGIQLAIGREGFDRLLAGAAGMDAHARHTPVESNLIVRHALTALWNRVAMARPTAAVVPYDQRLALLPAFLQQLVMESLGKSVREDGSPVPVPTSPVVWGGPGTDVQHSFFQALHQGTDVVPVEFIGVAKPAHPHAANHRSLLANLLAQAQALCEGEDGDDPARHYPGGRPSTVILLDELSPNALGGLLALYEHSVYLQGVLVGIDPFDQWGVELGKRLAAGVRPALAGEGGVLADAVTAELVERIRAHAG
ncbi:glucose-6-phosphate isomerase [Arenimonas composti]|uniref:Glucose-6-phosphate isomerase n=1 Tax=Arenimonas composti TR7-09 = DSM 18010 TaxID=1121013 RepID=A0A091B8S6_9GAMM|nr:glucose-6-phosphate isomerase [Arenimonas composti]KFN49033.1 hypothetical protein P873_12885 [Arenimonas composti TR7-09 = DSM 18010]